MRRVRDEEMRSVTEFVFEKPEGKRKLTTHLHLVPKLMRGAISPLPQYVFMAWCFVKHRDNFTFTFCVFNSMEQSLS
jgi:hypothetical protein